VTAYRVGAGTLSLGTSSNGSSRPPTGPASWRLAAASTLCVGGRAIYHVGFPEYGTAELLAPIIGNSVVSLASLLTMSPLAALFSHIAMHMSAVMHGLDTTVQLPPHYRV
jgi:hypothetical protein